MHNSLGPYNYMNECTTLNANIPKPISEKIPQIKQNRALTLAELLQLNLNQVIVINYECSDVKGILEYASDDYLVLHDVKTKIRTLYFLNHIRSILFEDDIRYLKK